MKKMNFLYTAAVVFLLMLFSAFSVFAQAEPEPEPEPGPEEATVNITSSETKTVPYVYTESGNIPGISITASDSSSVNLTVEEDVEAFLGGAELFVLGGGNVVLNTGGIRGGYGVRTYLNGGTVKAETDDLTASGSAALEIVSYGSGSVNFDSGDISSTESAVTIETGVDFSDGVIDNGEIQDPEEPGEDGWDDDDDWSDDDPYVGPDNSESGTDGSDNVPPDTNIDESGSGEITVSAADIDAGTTAVDIDLNDQSTVTLSAFGIYSDETAVSVVLSDNGGTVNITPPQGGEEDGGLIIDADKAGLLIDASAGTVTVESKGGIHADSAVEIGNYGGEVTLTAGSIEGNSGLYIETTDGTTNAETEDITVGNYGIYVWTYDEVEDTPFDPETGESIDGSGDDSGEGSDTSISVSVQVTGDISDDYEIPEPSQEDDIDDPIDDPVDSGDSLGSDSQSGLVSKAAADKSSDEEETSSGIIVRAETESSIDIQVSGLINASEGNEIIGDENSEISVSVGEDIVSDYGNSLAAYDQTTVTFRVGGGLESGGIALDTVAYSGTIDVTIGSDINVSDTISDDMTAGIAALSDGEGVTTIHADNGSINVTAKDRKNPVYGISAVNGGGDMTITVGGDVKAAGGSESIGLEVINDPESGSEDSIYHGSDTTAPINTNVEITGNLTGGTNGLIFETTEEADGKADILVTDTISGGSASVVVSDDTTAENFDLTVWKIEKRKGHAAVTPDGEASDIEPDIKYIVKIDPDSQDKITAVDEDGNPLETSHDFPVQKEGQKVYVEAINGYELTEAYNGRETQTALEQDEDGRFFLSVPKGGAIWLSAEKHTKPQPQPQPVYPSGSDDWTFYRIDWLNDEQLPGTGFSASRPVSLSARPRGLSYAPTGLTLQIPGLDVSEPIVIVPRMNGSYPVEWLESSVGLLEQSSLPGEGVAVLTGHNHLNTTETGPFLFIGTMEEGDRIMITDASDAGLIYKVYGNYKIASDGFAEIAGEVRENSLVLITCEDESTEGGYLNRRVILAEPL